LIAAAGNSHIKLFDVNSNSPQETFHYEGHQGNVTAVGFQKDNRWMYTGGDPWYRCRQLAKQYIRHGGWVGRRWFRHGGWVGRGE
jgi:hypothetical protein